MHVYGLAAGRQGRGGQFRQALKETVFAEYGIAVHSGKTYEVDHLVPLELGGSNSIADLFPEAAKLTPGFREKDRLENKTHTRVCAGARPLRATQRSIAEDWTVLYAAYWLNPRDGATAGHLLACGQKRQRGRAGRVAFWP